VFCEEHKGHPRKKTVAKLEKADYQLLKITEKREIEYYRRVMRVKPIGQILKKKKQQKNNKKNTPKKKKKKKKKKKRNTRGKNNI